MLLWVFYIWGQLLHWFVKADAVVRSTSPINTFRAWANANRRGLAVRVSVATVGLIAWIYYPDWIHGLAAHIAGYLTPGAVRSLIEKAQIPLNIATAFVYGLLVDHGLDLLISRVPRLAPELPKVNGDDHKADGASA